jgi:hypothetical protein
MDHPEGAGLQQADRLDFDRRVRLEFRGTQLSSDGGLLVMRELDYALGLSQLATTALRDTRRGKNTVHRLYGLFRQSVFGRLAGYEDVNDADRLALDPVMRQVVGGRAVEAQAASASQKGRFYNQRGTAEQHIKEGKHAFRWTRLSCRKFRDNEVRLQLHALAYNLATFLRCIELPEAMADWSLTSLQLKLIKIGARVVRHARAITFQLAEVAVTGPMVRAILAAIRRLRAPPLCT